MENHSGWLPSRWLEEEFEGRRRKNRRYSLRAFAAHLDLPPGRLSEYLSEKRRLTLPVIEKIADRLKLSMEDRARLLAGAAGVSANAILNRSSLSADEFTLISEWHYLAILSLFHTADLNSTPNGIAKRLGISLTTSKDALERLKRLGLAEHKKGRWFRTKGPFRTESKVPSVAIRKAHRQALEKAVEAIDGVPMPMRDLSFTTFAIDVSKLALAKRLIQQFHGAMEQLLEVGIRSEVYNLSVQLVPLTVVGKGE